MKRIKIINLSFDIKTKIVMLICISIAVCTIIYSFNVICIKNGNLEKVENKDLEYYINAKEYETTFRITVNSNKNSNIYAVKEIANLQEKKYMYVINEEMKINITPSEIRISKDNIDYEYITEFKEYGIDNFISFSSIINLINKINDRSIEGGISKVESNDKIIYKITLNEEYTNRIYKIDLIMLKETGNILEIKMYDKNDKEIYNVTFSSFIVKK